MPTTSGGSPSRCWRSPACSAPTRRWRCAVSWSTACARSCNARQGEERASRLKGPGPLTGIAAGLGVGALAGLARASRVRWRPVAGTTLTTVGVLIAANGPMTVLGITDPRTWSATDWLSDLVPHVAYAVVVERTMDALA